MYTSAFRARAKSPAAAHEICHIFRDTLPLGQSPGFIRGACTKKIGDPGEVVIYELWGTRWAFEAWETSEVRRQLVDQTASLIKSPWQMDLFEEV